MLKQKINIPNFINIIKRPNIMVDFRRFLQILSPEEQISEISGMINEINKSNCLGVNIPRKYRILKELETLKKQIMIN